MVYVQTLVSQPGIETGLRKYYKLRVSKLGVK